jgi:hypothetical protein
MGTPFVTVTEAGIDATTRGTAIVTAACDMVRMFTEQEITGGGTTLLSGTALLDGTGTDCLLLPQFPVATAGTVIENVGSDSPGTLTVNTDYKFTESGEVYRLPGVIDSGWSTQEYRTFWWPGRQNIQVTYTDGYTLADVPPELKEVAIQMSKRLNSQTNGNVVFESQGQRSIRYSGPATEWTTTERIVLDMFRRQG